MNGYELMQARAVDAVRARDALPRQLRTDATTDLVKLWRRTQDNPRTTTLRRHVINMAVVQALEVELQGALTRRRHRRVRDVATHDPAVVRAWATEQGLEVPARGPVPSTVVEAYLDHVHD